MIELLGYKKEKSIVEYVNTSESILKVRVEVYESYTNCFMFSNELDLLPNVVYYTWFKGAFKNTKFLVYDRNTNQLLNDFYFDGEKSVYDYDYNGYLKNIGSSLTIRQQMGLIDVLIEHHIYRNYEEIIDVNENDVVIDIGFNYGVFSLGAIKKGASKIYGFEPNKNVFNVISNSPITEKVNLFNYAVLDEDKILNFNEGENTLGSSVTCKVDDYKNTYEVIGINFYKFVKDHNINNIDFLKVDCEGTEYEIFNNIPDEFFKTIKKIHVEFHENDGKRVYELIEKLERNGFEWFLEPNITLDSDVGVIYAKQKTKKIVNISCYCDNEHKLNVLRKNIDILKNNNFDISLISPLLLPDNIQKSVDYCLIIKENPILDWPEHSMSYWYKFKDINGGNIHITTTYPDYGWAGLSHVKNSAKMFSQFDYDYYVFIVYDTILTDEVLHEIKKGSKCKFYPSKREDKIWKAGLHLVIFDKKNINNLIDSINQEEYSSTNYDMFEYVQHVLIEKNNFEIGKTIVEDEIYYYDEIDYFNHSNINDLPFFVSSPYDYKDTLKIVFHKELPNNKIKIILNNDIIFDDKIQNSRIIDLGVYKEFIKNVKIEYNDCEYDVTNTILNVKNSTLKLS
jgi:FkbM family methyltransferase